MRRANGILVDLQRLAVKRLGLVEAPHVLQQSGEVVEAGAMGRMRCADCLLIDL